MRAILYSTHRHEVAKHDHNHANQHPASQSDHSVAISTPFTNLQRSPSCACGGKCPRCAPLQAKLKIGKPGDRYEQEADRIADRVMRMPDDTIQSTPLAAQISPLIQRQIEPEEEEGDQLQAQYQDEGYLQRQDKNPEDEEEEEEEIAQPKMRSGRSHGVLPDVQQSIHTLRGGGEPLAPGLRGFFEPRLGRDLSGVRIHTNRSAAETAGTLNARAFTIGKDIVFGAGNYAPETLSGRQLLAHELTHVVQQSKGERFMSKGKSSLIFPAFIQRKWIRTRKKFEWRRIDDCLTLATPSRRKRCLLSEGKIISYVDIHRPRNWRSFLRCLRQSLPVGRRLKCLLDQGFVWPGSGKAIVETERWIPWRSRRFPFRWQGRRHRLVSFVWLGKLVSAHPALKQRLQSVESKLSGYGYSPRRVSSYRSGNQKYHSLGLAIDLDPPINIDIQPNGLVHRLIKRAIRRVNGRNIRIFGVKTPSVGWKDLNDANTYFKNYLTHISKNNPRRWRVIARILAVNITAQDLMSYGFLNLSWNVVRTLTDPYPPGAGLDWGGSDFNGTRRDIMHFDLGNRTHRKILRHKQGSPVPFHRRSRYIR